MVQILWVQVKKWVQFSPTQGSPKKSARYECTHGLPQPLKVRKLPGSDRVTGIQAAEDISPEVKTE